MQDYEMPQERLLRFHIERALTEQPTRALSSSKELLALAQQNNDKGLYGEALIYMGKSYLVMKNLPQAEMIFKQALEIFKIRENQEQIAVVLNALGAVAQTRKDVNGAIKYYFSALKAAKASKNIPSVYKPLVNLALIYNANGSHDTALNYIKQAITVAERWNIEDPKSRIYHIAAKLYEEQKDIVKSRSSCIEAIRYAEKENNHLMYATASLTLATLEIKMNKLPQAEKLMKALLQYDQKHGLKNNEVLCSIELVKLWFRTGNRTAAFTLLKNQVRNVRKDPKKYSPQSYLIFKLLGDFCRFSLQDIDSANRYYKLYLNLTKGVWKRYLTD